jgi:hypothetical protein
LNNVQSAQDLGDNQWYNLTLKKGNYWSDYNDVDKNFDGIGDNNYTTGGVFDRYPLGYFLKPPKKPSKPSPSDGKFGVTLQITLQVYVEDPDSNELDVYFYRAADNTLINGITQNPIKVRSKTNAIFKFVLGFHTTFAWYVVVDDGKLQNQSNTWFFATQTSPPDNEPPVADAGGPYAEEIGRTIIFDASDSNDPDGIIDFYRWNFGDGTSEILNKQTTHSYTNSGKYSVTLTVIDNDGSSATNTTIAEIGPSQNKPPVANINGPYEGVYGETILFSGGGSYDPDEEDILQYYWDFGDGTNGTGQSMPHEYSKSGRYVVTLTVTDSNGATDSDSINAEINAAASKKTPGYELIFSIIAILLVLALRRRR